MLVFDQLRKNDPQLQLLALAISLGFGVLLTGLWWVQIVNASRHRASVETQSFRTVRLPAVRGKILDRNGIALAENRPSYNISLYLEELSPDFRSEYKKIRPKKIVTNDLPFWKDWLGISPVKTQYLRLKDEETTRVIRTARYRVVQGVANKVANVLQTPLPIDPEDFTRHYETERAMPYELIADLSPRLVARFEEQSIESLGVDLDIQSIRSYPQSNVAAHIIGYVRQDDSSAVGEDAFFSYRKPDYRGLIGIEGGLDRTLRGRAGAKSVQVNNLGYRQGETIWQEAVHGKDVVLTIDIELQRDVETAIREAARQNRLGYNSRAAVVVMEVNSGDVLAMASYPTYAPAQFAHGISHRDYERIQELTAENNRATAENYQAGSVFKTIVALAALETPQARFNPAENYHVEENPNHPGRGIIYVGKTRQAFRDTVSPGNYDLQRAIAKSSNAYFIALGLRPGVFEKVIELGARLHLGKEFAPECLPLRQQAPGHFPTPEQARTFTPGDRANICIGQGKMDVTPMQVAVMISAIANGGTVYQPRLIDRFEPQNDLGLEPPIITPRAVVRDHLGISKRSLHTLSEAMLSETESSEGTGRYVQGCGFRVCGKTGTAERDQLRPDGGKRNTTWFASFAPYESPRYAVIVMVEDGASGGGTCVPIAHDVYKGLVNYQTRNAARILATTNR